MYSSAQPRTPSILARARRLGAGAAIAIAAQAAMAETTLTLDYSGVGNYSSSGFFTGDIDTTKTSGAALPGGFKLSGSQTVSDGIFWRYDPYTQQIEPGSSTTGFGMVWGGTITGNTTASDVLSAPFDFSLSFTNNLPEPNPNVSIALTLGILNAPFTPNQYSSGPTFNNLASTTQSFYYDTAGTTETSGTIALNLIDNDASSNQLYWYAFADVNWSSEFVSSNYWNGSTAKLSGDTLTFTVPNHSIDVQYTPGNAPTNNVPDGGSTAWLLGGALIALGVRTRRRRR